MKTQVRFRGIEASESLSEYASRRAHLRLSRFGSQVASVVVRISDLNGPRGGKDKRCQVTATGPGLGTVNVSETHDDAFAAVDLVFDRVSRTIGRNIERAREAHLASRTGA